MKRICVFCGSSPGARPEYIDGAKALGRGLAQRRIGLVYGGGSFGMMGALANAALESGGEVTGIIPEDLVQREAAHHGLSELHVVATMQERKQRMFRASDGFIIMPGGFGTLDEFWEYLTWRQLGFHSKPCGILNLCGYYDLLLQFIDHAVAERYVRPEHKEMIVLASQPEELLRAFTSFSGQQAATRSGLG